MFSSLKRRCVAGTTALTLGASLLAVPLATAESQQTAVTNQTPVNLPLACNLQTTADGFAASLVNGVYNSADKKYRDFKVNLRIEAPETVASGETFDYTILPSQISFPAKISGIRLKNVGQINFWLNLPESAHFEDLVIDGENKENFQISVENGRLHITGSDNAADVTQWTKDNRSDWEYAGLKPTMNSEGNQWVVALPKITLKMTATGAAGQSFQPSVGTLDAMEFSPESFLQLRAEALSYTGFARCNLSKYDTYWPGNRTGNTNLDADPFPAVEIIAAKYNTTATIQFQDAKGDPLAEGTDVYIDEGDSFGFTTYTVDSTGSVQLTFELAQDESKTIKAGFADTYEDAAKVVTITGTGAESTSDFTVQMPEKIVEKADNYAKVKLVDSAGNPLPAGTKFIVTVDGFSDQRATEESGLATVKVRLADDEEKEITVALAEDKDVSVKFKLTGGKYTDPDKGFNVPKALTKKPELPEPVPTPDDKADDNNDEELSSIESLQIPKTLGIILIVSLSLQSLFFIIKGISDFLNNLPPAAPYRAR